MKNLIKKLSVGIFAVAFTMGFGQKIDANAKTILDGVSTNYKSKKIIISNLFTVTEAVQPEKQLLVFSIQREVSTS
jgi:hypothetical protein